MSNAEEQERAIITASSATAAVGPAVDEWPVSRRLVLIEHCLLRLPIATIDALMVPIEGALLLPRFLQPKACPVNSDFGIGNGALAGFGALFDGEVFQVIQDERCTIAINCALSSRMPFDITT